MKSYTAEITPHQHHYVLHTIYTDTARQTRSEGWTTHATVDDALSFLDALCVQLGAVVESVAVADVDVLISA